MGHTQYHTQRDKWQTMDSFETIQRINKEETYEY